MERNRPRINVDLLNEIQELNFAIIETTLYLNTHPEDREVLELHNELSERYHELVDIYQKKYGPLYANYPDADYPWRWENDPWPWDITY